MHPDDQPSPNGEGFLFLISLLLIFFFLPFPSPKAIAFLDQTGDRSRASSHAFIGSQLA
jgi:hypothetical protein